MLTVTQNGQPITVDYTVENNLIPTTDELKDIMKQVFYFGHLSRNDDDNYNNGYSRNLNSIFYNYYLYPGLFENGNIKLYDENDKILACADLYNAFSGTDTVRGTVNINESKLYNYNNSVTAKLVMDLPTHVGNGNIKKLKLFAKPNYNGRINRAGTDLYNYKSNTLFCGSDIIKGTEIDNRSHHYAICFDKNRNIIIVDGTNDIICYNNKSYKYTGIVNKIFNIKNNFYILSSIDSTNKMFILKNIIFDDVNLVATIGTDELHLPYVYYSDSYKVPIIMTIVEIDLVLYSVYCDKYNNHPYVVKYNSDLTININNTIKTSITRPIGLYSYMLNDDNYMYFSNGNDSYYKLDIVNAKMVSIANADFYKVKNCIAFWDIYNLSNVIKINDVNYWFGQNDASYSAISPFMIIQKNPIKVPLTITFNTPITKTSEQTLKLILDINIQ